MAGVRGRVGIGAALAWGLVATTAAAGPPGAPHAGWAGGATFIGAAPASFTWTQLSVATTAVGNSNQIIGSTGPITVNQTSGPVFAFTGVPSANAWSLAGLLVNGGGQPASGPVAGGQGTSGGLVQTNTGAVTLGGIGVGPAANATTVSSPVTTGATSAAAGVANGAVAGLAGAATRGSGVPTPTPTGSVGASVGTALGGAPSVQLCASCLTGGVGG